MLLSPSPRGAELAERVRAFIDTEVTPIEADYHAELAEARCTGNAWAPLPRMKQLQATARDAGLWNLFLPAGHGDAYAARFGTQGGSGLSNVDYAPIAELMGRSLIAPYVFNCNAPDTGNAEVLLRYGSPAQQQEWLEPLLEAKIRSAFLMTEPGVASSDATTMEATAVVDGDEVIINGTKWWSTGIGHSECELLIFMGLTDPGAHRYLQHSMVIVPRSAPGVEVVRMLPTMGWYDEPHGHGEICLTDVRVPLSNIIAGPGRAFEIAQGRLGPGRIHHCMRLIGLAEQSLEMACRRALSRVAFGKPLANLGGNRERIADARIAINQARLHVLHAAWLLDAGDPAARSAVSEIKVAVPTMAQSVIDMAMQLHGGVALSEDLPLAAAWLQARAIRFADGPDAVHRGVVARTELAKYREASS
ncbi:acyl-CoA dehydrogenase family protein [Gordonia sp. NB41Y]|uniref:acyl-CoA dehydrogenase family protein n=1 Tax=Gordonia sp. NB41Y TaxID=875808 RepID=UPI0006B159D4|nr:acyl-CoA dehydrogenase family protein [Gordonia sp. NB41Y]EMP15212.2 acyl-CoA dehydrogenase [Gordonia sp. NB41Y]WLP89940.1 acyl-CoA dehydrogenase family protein [Gordonia sp. NB41Y]